MNDRFRSHGPCGNIARVMADETLRYRNVIRALVAGAALAASCGPPRDRTDWSTSLSNTTPPPSERGSGGEASANANETNRGGVCPASAPEPGTLCDVSRLPRDTCRYPAQTCAGDDVYRCVEGMWSRPEVQCIVVGPLSPPEIAVDRA